MVICIGIPWSSTASIASGGDPDGLAVSRVAANPTRSHTAIRSSAVAADTSDHVDFATLGGDALGME